MPQPPVHPPISSQWPALVMHQSCPLGHRAGRAIPTTHFHSSTLPCPQILCLIGTFTSMGFYPGPSLLHHDFTFRFLTSGKFLRESFFHQSVAFQNYIPWKVPTHQCTYLNEGLIIPWVKVSSSFIQQCYWIQQVLLCLLHYHQILNPTSIVPEALSSLILWITSL